MTQSSIVKQLDKVIGKLSNINYNIEGNVLGDAINAVAYVRSNVAGKQYKIKNYGKK